MDNRASKLGKFYIIFVFLLMYMPIFYLIIYSFSKGTTMANFDASR